MVAFDLDLANMFGSIEWPEIRAAVHRHFPEAAPWVTWCHAEPEVVQLPCGTEHPVTRGAGQGDVYGSALSSLALGDRLTEHRARMQHAHGASSAGLGSVDQWYVDDGQAFVRLDVAEEWLRSVDAAILAVGGSRSAGADCKSHARLLCTPAYAADHPHWPSDYIRKTCIIGIGASSSPKVLGVHIGSEDACSADMDKLTLTVAQARAAVEGLQDPAVELTLQRCCLNNSKTSHLLRCNGDRVDAGRLLRFDEGMAAGLASALGDHLPDDSWAQATLSVDAGGLGMREASTIAMPAFLASRVASRPMVAEMCEHTAAAGLCSAALSLQTYDARTAAAWAEWLQSLPEAVHGEARQLLADARDLAQRRWESLVRGCEPAAETTGGPPALAPGGRLIAALGTEDVEHPHTRTAHGAVALQQQLTRLADRCVAAGLMNKLRAQERWGDLHRLQDLSAPDASHDWLWAVGPHKGARIDSADEFTAAVRLRLGCGGPAEPVQCSCCGVATLQCSSEHALHCAAGESTRCHNDVRDTLHAIAKTTDSQAELEPEGLIASHPRLRPADVLTGAFHHGRLAAVDVGVISPTAAGAGLDCVVTMHNRKLAAAAAHQAELSATGVEYQPFAVSCWGRLHPAALGMLTNAAKRLARRKGLAGHSGILQSMRARITTALMRRAAKMLLQCLPRQWDLEADEA